MHEVKTDVMVYASYELVVKELRAHGAMTTAEVARRLGWERRQASHAIERGRINKLIMTHEDNARFVHAGRPRRYQAAHVPGWPYPAPDTTVTESGLSARNKPS